MHQEGIKGGSWAADFLVECSFSNENGTSDSGGAGGASGNEEPGQVQQQLTPKHDYPHTYASLGKRGFTIISPLDGKLAVGTEQEFAIVAPGSVQAAVIDPEHNFHTMEPFAGRDGWFITTMVPSQEGAVSVSYKEDAESKSFNVLAQYTAVTSEGQEQLPAGQEEAPAS